MSCLICNDERDPKSPSDYTSYIGKESISRFCRQCKVECDEAYRRLTKIGWSKDDGCDSCGGLISVYNVHYVPTADGLFGLACSNECRNALRAKYSVEKEERDLKKKAVQDAMAAKATRAREMLAALAVRGTKTIRRRKP